MHESSGAEPEPLQNPAGGSLANYARLAVGDLAAKALSVLALIHIAKSLGAAVLGDVAFAAALVAYAVLLVGNGPDLFGTRQAAADRDWLGAHTGAFVGLRTAMAVGGFATVATATWLLSPGLRVGQLVLVYGLALLVVPLSLRWLFEAVDRMGEVAGSQLIAQSIFAVGVWFTVHGPEDYLRVPQLQLVGQIAAATYLLTRLRSLPGLVIRRPDFRAWRPLLRGSLMLGLSAVLGTMLYNLDLVMIRLMRSDSETGQYYAAQLVVVVLGSLVTLYGTNMMPSIARYHRDPGMLQQFNDRAQKYLLMLTLPLAVGGAWLADALIEFAYGPEYSPSGKAFALLVWVLPAMALRLTYRLGVLAEGSFAGYLRINAIAVAVNAALNLALIPAFGIPGAAAASLVSEYLLYPLAYLQIRHRVTLTPLAPRLIGPILCCAPMLAGLYWTGELHVLIRVAVGAAIYMVCALMTGVLDLREMRQAWSRSAHSLTRQPGSR